ncbi:hypothetical protein M0R45_000302 [Rubus argutus]|uniref:Uncharacterized protein n=1 Tax=Rubus argutus TaxID=59490 RepID=A0AAW1VRI1_RUBAR
MIGVEKMKQYSNILDRPLSKGKPEVFSLSFSLAHHFLSIPYASNYFNSELNGCNLLDPCVLSTGKFWGRLSCYACGTITFQEGRLSLILSKTVSLEVDWSVVKVEFIDEVYCQDDSGNRIYR